MDLIDWKGLLIVALIFVPLERLVAMHPGQKIFRAGWQNDLVYAVINALLIKVGLVLVVVGTMTAAAWAIPQGFRAGVADLPVWLQLGLIILIADLGFYSAHRLFHVVPFLWRFHAVHHSIEELDWLAAHRVHPIDQIVTKTVSLVPVFALGFSDSAVALFGVMYYWHSLLLHANVRMPLGPAKWLVASPHFHHWHHSKDRDALDTNFAAQLPLIDAIFGTLYMPADKQPGNYGTDDPVPRWYLQQLIYPFSRAPGATTADEEFPTNDLPRGTRSR